MGILSRYVAIFCWIFCPASSRTKYALTAMKNLMDLEYGWAALDSSFIFKVAQIIASPQSLINVCRPATAILKRLVEADPASAPGPIVASSSRSPPVAPPGSVYRYGFDVVFEQMRKEPGLLETVVNRLGTADTALALNRYMVPIASMKRLSVRAE
jgi:engulfment/cell motility protein 1